MVSDYTRVNWKDESTGGTPINASNLNKMDSKIAELTAAVQALQALGTVHVLTAVPDDTYGNDGDIAVVVVDE